MSDTHGWAAERYNSEFSWMFQVYGWCDTERLPCWLAPLSERKPRVTIRQCLPEWHLVSNYRNWDEYIGYDPPVTASWVIFTEWSALTQLWTDYKFVKSNNALFWGVFTADTMKDVVFLDMTPCGYSKFRRFGEIYHLHLQGKKTHDWRRR
jgi:hypothetical protein